jgi:hypothetical protein
MNKLLVFVSLIGALSLSAFAQSDIKKVDFKNFTYNIGVFEKKEKITVKNGEFDRNTEEEKLFFSVSVESYGDLNGDGKEEAVIRTFMNTGGTGNFTNGIIFTIKDGKPVIFAEFEGGDRAYGGLVSSKIVNKLLVVEKYDVGEEGGACCPELTITTNYEWKAGKFVQVGKEQRKELYPVSNISFKKGKLNSVLSMELDDNQVKRFSINAKKGQTLTVTTNFKPAETITYDLRKGDGEVITTESKLVVKLNKTGKFVFQIANSSEKRLEFAMTVEIK